MSKIKVGTLFVCALFIFAIAGCTDKSGPTAPAPVSPKPATSAGWTALAPMPSVGSGVEGASVASVGNTIIAALGYDSGSGDTQATRLYDISSDTWSLGAPAPGASSEGAGIAHGGLFYTVGGRDVGPRDDIWSYDLASDSWNASLTPMPTPRAGLALAVVGNAIYAIGGRTTTQPGGLLQLDDVERYDIDADTWTAVAPLPAPRSDLAAATVGGKIYVFGGFDAAGSLVGDVDVYDPTTDSWSTAPADLPTPRASLYAVGHTGGTVYVIGGWDGIMPFNPLVGSTVESYKVAQDAWTVGLSPMPTPRSEFGVASHGGRIYVVGGAQPAFGSSVGAVEVFNP